MTKQEEFLWIVQTVILAKAARMDSNSLTIEDFGSGALADVVFVTMAEAVRVSADLPGNLTVADAAHDFCTYMLPDPHDEVETPDWLQSQTRRTAAG